MLTIGKKVLSAKVAHPASYNTLDKNYDMNCCKIVEAKGLKNQLDGSACVMKHKVRKKMHLNE